MKPMNWKSGHVCIHTDTALYVGYQVCEK